MRVERGAGESLSAYRIDSISPPGYRYRETRPATQSAWFFFWRGILRIAIPCMPQPAPECSGPKGLVRRMSFGSRVSAASSAMDIASPVSSPK